MVTELDHDAIKERIVLILKANTATLYDPTGANSKIRQINVGHPDHAQGLDNVFPNIYVTNANPLDRIRESGTMTSGDESLPPLDHKFRYKIIIQAQSKGARSTEKILDDWQKITLETLEADHQFKGVPNAAVVDGSRPELIELFRADLNGKPIQGRIITYLCSKVTI